MANERKEYALQPVRIWGILSESASKIGRPGIIRNSESRELGYDSSIPSNPVGMSASQAASPATLSTISTFSMPSISWNLTSMISMSEVCTVRPM